MQPLFKGCSVLAGQPFFYAVCVLVLLGLCAFGVRVLCGSSAYVRGMCALMQWASCVIVRTLGIMAAWKGKLFARLCSVFAWVSGAPSILRRKAL